MSILNIKGDFRKYSYFTGGILQSWNDGPAACVLIYQSVGALTRLSIASVVMCCSILECWTSVLLRGRCSGPDGSPAVIDTYQTAHYMMIFHLIILLSFSYSVLSNISL